MSTISRRTLLVQSVASAVALSLPMRRATAADWFRYREAIVIDGLGGPGGGVNDNPDAGLSEQEVKDAHESGVTCAHITVGAVGSTAPDTAFMETVRGIAYWEREIDRHPDVLGRVRVASDIGKAKKNKRCGLVYGVQDGVAFETDLARLDDLHALGLRVVQPTYNRRNLLGDGCLEPGNAGLSRSGIEAIERMNSLGILIDLSHCGRQTAADAIRISKKPVAFTHTGSQALSDHPRNRTDAELRAVADKGGVSGIYFMPYLSEGRQPTAADIVRHVEHMVQVAGEDHVSIGTDGNFSPTVVDQKYKDAFAKNTRERREAGIGAPWETEEGYLFAADLNTPRRLATLAMMLADRRHSAARIEKILGGNLLRVFGDTWKG
ncbi:MAG TPA: membrane dipeptidase [Steroidobacteraceae bacterium]|jgi:membrane dipeptidase|nr:membrane dipeptidase [Steroidobacteraceae bacterium]